MSFRGFLLSLSAAVMLVSSACAREGTQVLVQLDADAVSREMAHELRVVITSQEGDIRFDRAVVVGAGEGQVSFPTIVPVSPLGGDASRAFLLEASLISRSERTFSIQRVLSGFSEHERIEVTRRFSDVCAGNLSCRADETCSDGSCVDALEPGPWGEVSVGPPWCLRTEDCTAEEVCSLSTGVCTALDSAMCGLPTDEAGEAALSERCWPTRLCGSGLTCVPRTYALDADTGLYGLEGGTCFRACDPCAPDCPAGNSCLALSDGGGVCHRGSLSEVPECDDTRLCARGQHCERSAGSFTMGGFCTTRCLPDDRSVLGAGDTRTPYDSADCGAGQLCVLRRQTVNGDFYACFEGAFVPTGTPCSGRRFCTAPDTCDTHVALCSPDCLAGEACPEGVDCFDIDPSTEGGSCIPDGAIEEGLACVEDRNCAAGLECVPGTPSLCQLAE